MKSFYKWSLAAAPLLICGMSFVHPNGRAKDERSSGALLMGAEVPSEVAAIIGRSCQNCHSERTAWPWYSYVAPMSWMIESDVHDARNHMNLSRWGTYTSDHQVDLLTRLAVEVRNGKMPLPRYLKLHPEARLSRDEAQELNSWAHTERKRLRTVEVKGKASTD